jgi:hypothetical protein
MGREGNEIILPKDKECQNDLRLKKDFEDRMT